MDVANLLPLAFYAWFTALVFARVFLIFIRKR